MINSEYDQGEFVKLNCGCVIQDNTGEMHQECLSHEQAYFVQ